MMTKISAACEFVELWKSDRRRSKETPEWSQQIDPQPLTNPKK
jgi:hypothetical protein